MCVQGFAEDIEKILQGVVSNPADNKHQTLLYSATMPKWVQQVMHRIECCIACYIACCAACWMALDGSVNRWLTSLCDLTTRG